jgi:MFS family permease
MSVSSIIRKPVFIVYLGGFMYSIHLALTLYINSSFLKTYFSDNITGILFSISALITIIGLAVLPHFLKRFGEKKVLVAGLLTNVVFLAGLALVAHPVIIPVLFVVYFSLNSLLLFGIDVAIEDVSDPSSIGTMRGLFLTLRHAALMGAPLVSGLLIERYDFPIVYGLGAIVMLVSLFTFSRIKKIPEPAYQERPLFQTIRILRRSKNMAKIFTANFLLQFFYVWMVIYVPIYLVNNLGMSWGKIGGLITVMLAAFVLFDYPLGKIADTKKVTRTFLIVGFIIMAIAVAIIPLITTTKFIVWAAVLFGTRIGAAAVEVMTEAYFFKHTDPGDVSTMSLFRDTQPLAYLSAPIIATILINTISISSVFIALAIILVIGACVSRTLPHHHHMQKHAN